VGPPRPLSAFLFDPPHSLVVQSYAPTDMRRGGRINADGFGVGWYPAGARAPAGQTADAPVRYRRDCPIWTDANLRPLATTIRAGALLAAVRNATTGMPVLETAAAPFTDGPWLFSHNGAVTGFPDSVAGLAAALPPRDLLTLDAPTDAALLWALVRHALRNGADPAKSIVDTVHAVADAAPGSRLNLLLTDGRTIVATTWWHALSVRAGPGSALISSEPLDDDPAWQPVPDRHLVVATVDGVRISPLTREEDPVHAR
jgi:glutamine amidotransferase